MSNQQTPQLNNLSYSIPEFCRATGLGRSLTYELIKSGNIQIRKCGTRTLILHADALNFLESLPAGGNDA